MNSLPTLMSGLTILFCLAVLVQAFRLDRRLKAVQTAEHSRMVEALDTASDRAEEVTRKLRDLLRSEGATLQAELSKGREVADELVIMVGVADAAAERLANKMEESSAAKKQGTAKLPAKRKSAKAEFKGVAADEDPKPKPARKKAAKPKSTVKHFPRRRVEISAANLETASC